MVGVKVRTKMKTRKLKRKAQTGAFKSLGHAGATIRLLAKRSIRKRKKQSPEGAPPSTQTKRLPHAIVFAVEKQRLRVLIGPAKSLVGMAGAEHEHGGKWRRERFEKRPFMAPALEKARNRLPRHWAGSVR